MTGKYHYPEITPDVLRDAFTRLNNEVWTTRHDPYGDRLVERYCAARVQWRNALAYRARVKRLKEPGSIDERLVKSWAQIDEELGGEVRRLYGMLKENYGHELACRLEVGIYLAWEKEGWDTSDETIEREARHVGP